MRRIYSHRAPLCLTTVAILAAGTIAGTVNAAEADPFAGMEPKTASLHGAPKDADKSWFSDFTEDNFLFRGELFSQFTLSRDALENGDGWRSVYSRQSLGFEVQKKFSTDTKTFLGIDYQGRLVRRDNYRAVTSDLMGADHEGWAYETHNAYADLYDLAGDGGTLNLRAGRYYVPFGLNLYTDTHGTLTQLSNERNFGFERDWYAGLYGALGEDFAYDAYYAIGSGEDIRFKGQAGLGALRIGTGNRPRYENGLEAGFSILGGERISEHAIMRSASVEASSRGNNIVRTWRVGPDVRKRFATAVGTVTLTGELSGGQDENDAVVTGLVQADWLSSGRRFGVAVQYRHFWQDIGTDASGARPGRDEASVIVNASYYFANDVGNASIHAITLGVEQQTARQAGPRDTLITLQYYRYW